MIKEITYRQREIVRFYLGLISILAGGLIVLFVLPHFFEQRFTVCFLQNAAGIPCPACGTGRGLEEILHGHWWQAVLLNPLSIVVFIGTAITAMWLILDLLKKDWSLYKANQKLNGFWSKKPVIAVVLIVLLAANWIWNFYKF